MNTDTDIHALIQGYEKFRHCHYDHPHSSGHLTMLAREGQKPKIMIISCCDSRVDPSIVFNCAPGELFVVRNVANLVPPCDPTPHHHSTSSALEFAVQTLLVKHIIILGHSQCGGIQTLLENRDLSSADDANKGFIFNWMQIAKGAKEKVLREDQGESPMKREKDCCEESLRISLGNLKTFPWIKDKIEKGQLSLHAWRFDLVTGNLQQLSPTMNQFENILNNTKNH